MWIQEKGIGRGNVMRHRQSYKELIIEKMIFTNDDSYLLGYESSRGLISDLKTHYLSEGSIIYGQGKYAIGCHNYDPLEHMNRAVSENTTKSTIQKIYIRK